MGLWPLHQRFGLKRYFAATYQSVSGTGAGAVRELEDPGAGACQGPAADRKVYPYQIAFNVIPQVDTFGANGYTGEETKMMQESRKIMGLPESPGFRHLRARVRWCAPIRWRSTPSSSGRSASRRPGPQSRPSPARNWWTIPRASATRRRLISAGKVKCGVGRIRVDTALDNGLSLLGERRQPLEGRRAQCHSECRADGARWPAPAEGRLAEV